MITLNDFNMLVHLLDKQAVDDIMWAENLSPPESALEFAIEVIFVICNSGMKNTIAQKIYDKVMIALNDGKSASTVFKHEGKTKAIDYIWRNRYKLFTHLELLFDIASVEDILIWLEDLPWIGKITKYHVAKNFGIDVAKPDVHLQRLADIEGTTVQKMCKRLSTETKYRTATVDTILWRACANGVMNSKTGQIQEER